MTFVLMCYWREGRRKRHGVCLYIIIITKSTRKSDSLFGSICHSLRCSCEYFITLYALRAQYVCFRNECITYHVKCETTYILVFAKCIGLTSCLICRRLKHGARYVCRVLELVNFPKQMHPFD